MQISRRTLLGAAGGAGLVAAAGGVRLSLNEPADAAAALPAPDASGIEHVVVVMMENRSFDHVLGWLPGADGKQAGLTYRDRYGKVHPTFHLPVLNSCGYHDPDHSYEGGRIQYNHGRVDGWLRSGENDLLSIGYYEQADLPFLGQASTAFTTCDRYFAGTMAETYPNRFYMHSAQTDRTHNSTATCTLPTIWDRLSDAGLAGTYYFGDIPFTALWHDKYIPISKPYQQFTLDAAAGLLPQVSFVDPRFEDEGSGTSADDHPHADMRAGEAFLNGVYDAVRNGPGWDKTVMVVTFDEWGGFYDHVRPSRAPDAHSYTSLRGFRVPTIVISPMARRSFVSHTVLDHTSILKMIEWRWDLPALSPRDAHATNLATILDFQNSPQLATPTFAVPSFTALGCSAPSQVTASEFGEWPALRNLALSTGWELPQ